MPSELSMAPAYLDTRGAAAYLSLAPRKLERLRDLGVGPVFVRVGRLIRYRVAALDAWMAAREVGSTADPVVLSSPCDSGPDSGRGDR